jgi:hypothetical protein
MVSWNIGKLTKRRLLGLRILFTNTGKISYDEVGTQGGRRSVVDSVWNMETKTLY